ncbi:MAG: hypothetical protein ACRDE5_13135, partial [Ginsengibacter sp.]
MEVHHHPHVEKKNFKEYFLEFLMIFLAVTLGFFAESFREHLVETTREKGFMKEIVENLKYDTICCHLNAESNNSIEDGLDSLRAELKNAINGKINGNALYYLTLQYAGNIGIAVFNTSAINELKNSGSLRLIENKKLINEISDYYERKIFAAEHFKPSDSQQDELVKIKNEFFSLKDLDDYVQSYNNIDEKIFAPDYNYQNVLKHIPALQLLKSTPVDLE